MGILVTEVPSHSEHDIAAPVRQGLVLHIVHESVRSFRQVILRTVRVRHNRWVLAVRVETEGGWRPIHVQHYPREHGRFFRFVIPHEFQTADVRVITWEKCWPN